MNQKLAGRRVQVDCGSTRDQMEEGQHLAVKRGCLDRVHGYEGNIAPSKETVCTRVVERALLIPSLSSMVGGRRSGWRSSGGRLRGSAKCLQFLRQGRDFLSESFNSLPVVIV